MFWSPAKVVYRDQAEWEETKRQRLATEVPVLRALAQRVGGIFESEQTAYQNQVVVTRDDHERAVITYDPALREFLFVHARLYDSAWFADEDALVRGVEYWRGEKIVTNG